MKVSRSLVLGAVLVAALTCGASWAWAGGNAPNPTARATPAQVKPMDAATTAAGLNYVPITQCTAVDTRFAEPLNGPIGAWATRDFNFSDPNSVAAQGGAPSGCAVPTTATAIQVVITTTGATGPGVLGAWPTNESFQGSVLSYNTFDTSTAATLRLNQGNLRVEALGTSTNVEIDLAGYYTPPAGPTLLTGSINADGSRRSGPHITKSVLAGSTQYQVTFDRDITSCTFALTSTSGAVPFGGPNFYDPDGQTFNTLLVSWTVFGAANPPFELSGFNVTGICPA
jgi:hypothetical protein